MALSPYVIDIFHEKKLVPGIKGYSVTILELFLIPKMLSTIVSAIKYSPDPEVPNLSSL